MPADNQEFLAAYQRELIFLRQMGAEFAQRYPKIAARLDLSEDTCADPHVERLIESFAFLTARLQGQLDAEFPVFTGALLGALYPHFTAPMPSLTVARFVPDPDQPMPGSGYEVPRHTPLFTQGSNGALVRFRTCYPTTLWPVTLTEARVENTDAYPFLDSMPKVAAVLRLRLTAGKGGFGDLSTLRFFVNAEPQTAFAVYDLLCSAVQGVALCHDKKKDPVVVQPPSSIRPAGFADNETILPTPEQGHPGYRLLQEYFAFPEKFLFFDLDLTALRQAKRTVDVLILLDEAPRRRLTIDAETFALGCTPIANLFERTTEPIRLEERQPEYRLVADSRQERSVGIHSLISVSASEDPSTVETVEPIFSYRHPADTDNAVFFHAQRRPTGRAEVPGTDFFLTFVDMRMDLAHPPHKTVYAHTLCTNRDLAAQMPANAELSAEDGGPFAAVVCLRKPTPQIDPPAGGASLWRLISQLSLNHLSLSGGDGSLSALKELLRLYRFNPLQSEDQINGIRKMACRPILRHLGEDAWRGFRQGLEVTLTFDETLYVGSSALLLSAVLSRFFGLYAAINSFTQLVVRSEQRQEKWKVWEPLAGALAVL